MGRTIRLHSVVSLLGCLLAAPALAAPPHRDEPKPKSLVDRCLENVDTSAFKNSQFEACFDAELKRRDDLLNQAFRSLKAHLDDPDRLDQMVKAQQSWVAFRDKWCGFEESSDNAPSHEANRLICLVDLTKAQTERLKQAAE